MSSTKLKDDLSNCLITFDSRVLITELVDDYKCTYEEVNKIVEDYIVEQQKKDKIKFEKIYLICGVEEGEIKKEIFKTVEESKIKDWLAKLKNSESSLYSVEVMGGAKAAAPVFKPMSIEECAKSERKQGAKTLSSNSVVKACTSSGNKKEVKQETKESPKESLKSTTTTETSVKNDSKTETSPADKKVIDKKVVKKGINKFFSPSTSAAIKKSDDSKTVSAVIKPTTPKKMQDYFKKQSEQHKRKTENLEKSAINTSVQLFQEDEPEEKEEASSDEEENLEALKRDIISSDVEMEDENESKQSTSVKRRRILDSDDEEDPPVKQEKIDIKEETEEEEPVAETYLDEDGFVITKKPKQSAISTRKSPSNLKTPPVTMKASSKDTKKSSSGLKKETKAPIDVTAKTKQAGIMNFFCKK